MPFLATVLALACATFAQAQMTTIVVVRHAEKVDSSRDPDLSETGRQRAQLLSDLFRTEKVTALYATEYKRTQQTLQPLAQEQGLEVEIHPASDKQGLVDKILADHVGGLVVVASHSGDVPKIVELLGAGSQPPIAETEYDNLYIVTRSGETAHAIRLQFRP